MAPVRRQISKICLTIFKTYDIMLSMIRYIETEVLM